MTKVLSNLMLTTSPKRNSAMLAKADLRRALLNAIPRPVSVFDAFAGDGAMFRLIWNEADNYVGCDLDWWRDDRKAYACDNRRVMRTIDLSRFNIFDFDAYGSPWDQAIILTDRRPVRKDELIGVLLTDGSVRNLKQGNLANGNKILAGFKGRPSGLIRGRDEILARTVKGFVERFNCDVVQRWEVQKKTHTNMAYIALLLRGR